MDAKYKIIISGKNLYKEVELSEGFSEVTIGTEITSDVRLNRDLYFEQIELICTKSNGDWSISCADNLFFDIGDVRKLMTKQLSHGDSFAVKYQSSDNTIFNLDFVIDFDTEQKDYDIEISITNKEQIKIGGSKDCEIRIDDEYIGTESLLLTQNMKQFTVVDNNYKYGVYVNGVRINKKHKLSNYDFFSIASYSFYIKDGKLYTSRSPKLSIKDLTTRSVAESNGDFKYPKFNRSPRLLPEISKDPISILDPPEKPEKPKNNLIMSLLPSLGMLLITVLLRSSTSGNMNYIILSVCTMSIGIATSVFYLH